MRRKGRHGEGPGPPPLLPAPRSLAAGRDASAEGMREVQRLLAAGTELISLVLQASGPGAQELLLVRLCWLRALLQRGAESGLRCLRSSRLHSSRTTWHCALLACMAVRQLP